MYFAQVSYQNQTNSHKHKSGTHFIHFKYEMPTYNRYSIQIESNIAQSEMHSFYDPQWDIAKIHPSDFPAKKFKYNWAHEVM